MKFYLGDEINAQQVIHLYHNLQNESPDGDYDSWTTQTTYDALLKLGSEDYILGGTLLKGRDGVKAARYDARKQAQSKPRTSSVEEK
jgi:hypothetical protein